MSTELIELFEKLSVKIAKIYDVKLSGEITDVYEDLVSSTVQIIGERNKLEDRYWDLARKLGKCERERARNAAQGGKRNTMRSITRRNLRRVGENHRTHNSFDRGQRNPTEFT